MGADIGELTRDTIPTDVLEADRPVIIDVWGPQCVPCIALSPTFERLAGEFGDRARFMKLEAPKNRMAVSISR
jgi:thioredoxin 1